ncbi:MAG: hypothetical protein ACRDVZ_03935, partial [Jiangellaceae bacterium]
ARGLAMSASCLLVPTAAHVAAGGGVPTEFGFIFAATLLAVACVALADRRRSAAEIGVVLIASQPALHILFELGSHTGQPATPGWSMVLAHMLAAAGLTVVLAGAESVLWSLASLSVTVLISRTRRLLGRVAPTPPRLRPPPVHPDLTIAFVLLLPRSAPRRGPPALQSI